MKKAIFAALCVGVLSAVAFSQPRAPEKAQTVSTATEWQVRYEGGVFGSSNKEHGTIKVDEANQRVIFVRQSDGREMYSIPYEALIVLYSVSESDSPQSGK